MSDLFYERARDIDELKALARPTVADADELKARLDSETMQKYFFHDLENAAWIPPLHAAGILAEAPRKREIAPGQYQLPIWHAGRFLSRHASQFPDIVVDVARSLDTDNPQAYAELLKSLAQIEPSEARKAVPSILDWLQLPFSDQLLYELKDYMGSLMKYGYFHDVARLVGALLEPAQPLKQTDQQKAGLGFVEAKPRFGEFWLEEVVREFLPELTKEVPQEVLVSFDANLAKAQEFERDASGEKADVPVSSYWRSAIEPHPQNSSLYALKGLLVDGIRDSLLSFCSQGSEECSDYLERYISSEDSIRRRMALYILSMSGMKYPALVEAALSDRSSLDDSEIHHEMYGLLAAQFVNLPAEHQERIVAWLLDGPQDIEAVTRWVSDRAPEEDLEREVLRYREYWSLRRIWAIREHLEGEAEARVEELGTRLGEPDHPDLLMWSTGARAITHVTPVTEEEMAGLAMEEIIERIKEYVPPTPGVEHSREGLAEALAGAVKADPARFVGLAAQLIDEGVQFVYTYHYLAAIREAIEQVDQLDLGPILELCSYIASLAEDPHEQNRDRYEAGLRVAQLEVANLVEALLKQEKIDLNEEKEDRILGVIRMLLKNPDPEADSKLESGWDPATRSLNCVRGKAMHDVIGFARYRDKEAKKRAGEGEYRPRLDPFVKEVFEEKLDKSVDSSLSVHSVYGWYVPLIEYFDKDWMTANLDRIFPQDPDLEGFWRAAWDAYVSFNNVYTRPFNLLIPQYSRAISVLGEPEDPERLGTTKGERLGEHLAFAYIHGVIDLESDDALLSSFYEAAGDDLRGHIGFWLAKVLSELKLEAENPIWQRMWRLMDWRLKEAAKSGNVELFREEVSSYMRWLESAPASFSELEPIVRMAIPFLKEGYHKKLVADYLARHAEQFPHEAVEMIYQVILLSDTPWFSLYEDDLDAIIGFAVRSKDEKAIEEAVAVINIVGERGDFRWKKYLPNQ